LDSPVHKTEAGLATFLALLNPKSSANKKKDENNSFATKSDNDSRQGSEGSGEEKNVSFREDLGLNVTSADAVAISCLESLMRLSPKLPQISRADSEKKTRVPMACTRCKMSHTRCDTKRPCGRCVRRGEADSCVDAIPKRRGRKRSEDATDLPLPTPPTKTLKGSPRMKPISLGASTI
jgi:hypothetical protein